MFATTRISNLDLSKFDTSNVTNMNFMFYGSQVPILDLNSFDTSNVTSMYLMFRSSITKTGYAKTQADADADKLNVSSNKPSSLNFIFKSK